MKAMQYLILVWGWWLILSVSYAQTVNSACETYEKDLDQAEILQQEQPDKTILIAREVLAEAERRDCLRLQIRCYLIIGTAYELMGRSELSLPALQKGLALAGQGQEIKLRSTLLGNIGLYFGNRGDYPRATNYALQALRLAQESKDYFNISSIYNHLGSIYADQGQYDSALMYFHNSYKLLPLLKDEEGVSFVLSNIATINVLNKNYREGERYYLEGLQSAKKHKMIESVCNTYQNLGNLYYETGQWKKAIAYLDSSYELSMAKKYANLLPKIWMTYGQVFQKQKEYKKALVYMDRADSVAHYIKAWEDVMNVAQLKYQLFKAQNKWQQALQYYEAYTTMKDSLQHESKMQEIGRLQGQYQAEQQFNALERKRQEVEAKRTRANNQQYLLIFSGVLALMVGLLFLSRLPIKVWMWNLLVFLTFMLIFESVLVYVDYRMMPFTEGKPFPTLMVNFILAAIFTGFHQLIQQKLDLFFVRSAVRFRALRRLKKKA
jgi:tetratricopeptide (TPR) repeat protein